MTNSPNSDEAEYWSGPSGLSWIERENDLDASFQSVTGIQGECVEVTLVALGTARDLVEFSTRVRPAASVIHLFEASQADKAAIADELTIASQPFEQPSGVHIPTSIGLFTATLD